MHDRRLRTTVPPSPRAPGTAALVLLAVALAPLRAPHAQQPELRRVVPVRATLSTPERGRLAPDEVARRLQVPAGFRVRVWAEGLGNPRMFAIGDDGTLYVTRRDSNDVLALRDDGSGRAGAARKVVTDLRQVHGIAFHEGKLYLATIKEVWVADRRADGTVDTPRAIVTDLPDGGQHPNRTLAVGPDGMLYVTVGSTCNACAEPDREHATMLRLALDGTQRGIHARGLRNTLGFAWHPTTGALWGMDHGSDWRGNDRPHEELNEIRGGSDYGWPWCWGDRQVDSATNALPPGRTTDRTGHCRRTAGATRTYTAHAAPMQLAFYTGSQFPADYRHDAFVAMRGSWNREPASGYEIVRVRFRDGRPERIEPFLTGFLDPDGRRYHARPVGLAVTRDGALLVGDDTNGVIYRVSWEGASPARPPARGSR